MDKIRWSLLRKATSEWFIFAKLVTFASGQNLEGAKKFHSADEWFISYVPGSGPVTKKNQTTE